MSTRRTASCPGCGATIALASAATVVVTCPSCGGLSYRSDVDLSLLGSAAEVAAIASPLALGATGRFEGRGWTCVGQVQLDHGAGPWNEWCLLGDDGETLWYAEAQGETLLTRRAPGLEAAAPPRAEATPGTGVELEGRTWIVAEAGEATVVAVRGEVAVRRVPGSRVRYADLRADDGAFGTLDYGAGDACEAVYLGRTVSPAELGLDPAAAAPVERTVGVRRVDCPQCAGVVTLRDPESVRAVCEHCGALLDPRSRQAKALGVAARLKDRPRIPLGAEGRLGATRTQVVGFLVRSVRSGGVRYPWREYLLRTDAGAYRWLVESSGHWALLDPVNPAELGHGLAGPRVRGREYRPFQSGEAVVDHVQGEVYWRVEVGEKVRSHDYVAPPWLLTVEASEGERNATVGRYVEPKEVEDAFGVHLDRPRGVAPAQPNPWQGQPGRYWAAFFAMAAALALLVGLVGIARPGRVGWFFPLTFVVGGLLVPPVVVSTRRSQFEVTRWADSDHPVGG